MPHLFTTFIPRASSAFLRSHSLKTMFHMPHLFTTFYFVEISKRSQLNVAKFFRVSCKMYYTQCACVVFFMFSWQYQLTGPICLYHSIRTCTSVITESRRGKVHQTSSPFCLTSTCTRSLLYYLSSFMDSHFLTMLPIHPFLQTNYTNFIKQV